MGSDATSKASARAARAEGACRDFREFLQRLEMAGELVRIKSPVDPHDFELSAFIRHEENGPNRALIFEQVEGFDVPVAANVYGSMGRCLLGVGIAPTAEAIARYRADPRGSGGGTAGHTLRAYLMDDAERAGLVIYKERLLEAERQAAAGEFRPHLVPTGPCKEVVLRGDEVDLLRLLPVPRHCELDAGPFINAGVMVQRDADTGILNAGVRRHQTTPEPYGPRRLGVYVTEALPGYRLMLKDHDRGRPHPVAICIGVDPATEIFGCFTSPHLSADPPWSEFDSAGALTGRPLDLVKCETVDLEVPATSEIVIEGYIPPGGRLHEGPMAEFTELYAQTGPLPYVEVTCVTHRRQPIFHTIMSGRSEEHRSLGITTGFGHETNRLAQIQKAFPSVQACAFFAGSFDFHLVVSLRQRYPGEDKALLHFLIGTTYHKFITIVDDDIDVRNSEQVEWARAMRAGRPDSYFIFPRTPTWSLEPLKDENGCVDRLGVLATLPFGQRFVRTGPPAEVLERTRAAYLQAVGPPVVASSPSGPITP